MGARSAFGTIVVVAAIPFLCGIAAAQTAESGDAPVATTAVQGPVPGPPAGTSAPVKPAPNMKPASGYPQEATESGLPVAKHYFPSRWAEDWTFLRRHGASDDPFDPVKFVPFDGEGSVYLTLNGQQRIRYNLTTSPGLRSAPNENRLMVRTVIGANLGIGEHLRFYGEVANAILEGKNKGTVSASNRNEAIILQRFAELRVPVPGDGIASFRYGRQEFLDGPSDLLSVREGANVRMTQNGWTGAATWKDVRLRAFDFRPTIAGLEGIGDDDTSSFERLRGVSAGIVVRRSTENSSGNLYLDPFYYRYDNDLKAMGAVIGREERSIFGARFWGDVGPVSIDWNGIRQTGSFDTDAGSRKIDAYGIFLRQNVALSPNSKAPRVGVNLSRSSGGGTSGSGKVRTYSFIYGGAHLWSYGLFLNANNLTAIEPTLEMALSRRARFSFGYEMLWRTSMDDFVYNAQGNRLSGSRNDSSRRVGDLSRLNFVRVLTRHASLNLFVEYFDVSRAMRSGGQHDSLFIGQTLALRF